MAQERHERSPDGDANRFVDLVNGGGFWRSVDLRFSAIRSGRRWMNLITRGFLDHRSFDRSHALRRSSGVSSVPGRSFARSRTSSSARTGTGLRRWLPSSHAPTPARQRRGPRGAVPPLARTATFNGASARQIRRPVFRERPPLQQVSVPAHTSTLVLDHMRQRGLDDFPGMVCLLGKAFMEGEPRIRDGTPAEGLFDWASSSDPLVDRLQPPTCARRRYLLF